MERDDYVIVCEKHLPEGAEVLSVCILIGACEFCGTELGTFHAISREAARAHLHKVIMAELRPLAGKMLDRGWPLDPNSPTPVYDYVTAKLAGLA